MALAGYNPTHYDGPIFSEIDYAAYGKPFNDATYGGVFNVRKAAKYQLKSRTRKDVIGRDYLDMYDASLDLELYADKIKTLYNMFLLLTNGPINLRLKLPSGQWINHVDNGVFGNGNPSTPASGSWLMGGTMQFDVSGKDRSIKAKLNGGGYRNEMAWLDANSASGAAGGSSGNAITGLTHMHYDLTEYGVAGIVAVTVDGVSLGALEDGTKMTLDFKEMGKIQTREWPIIGTLETKIEIPMWQVSIPDELTSAELWALSDHTVNFTLGDGMVISYVNSLIPTLDLSHDESKSIMKIGFESRIPIDRPSWGATNIVFDTTANTLTVNKTAYA